MLKKNSPNIAYLTTFPPRACGIATFSHDLISAIDDVFAPSVGSVVIAMQANADEKNSYPPQVIGLINQQMPQDFRNAALLLNSMPEVVLVAIQHEFGIFGEQWGYNLRYFLEDLSKPVITTFHTVLPNPSAELWERVDMIAEKSFRVVVMTAHSKHILESDYSIAPEKIEIVPHGIHLLDYISTKAFKSKKKLFLEAPVLSTFGLLSRGKGIEYAIQAMPAIIEKYPRTMYLIIGSTHPNVVKEEGESYRLMLQAMVTDLRLEKHVRFYDQYVPLPKLLEFLQMTDIYISPSLNPNQAVSGTLSYALGAGRPVVSTAFAQAKSIITPEVGMLVNFRQPEEMSTAIIELLHDPRRLEQMGENAYFRTRHMTWQNVALSYMRIFSEAIPSLAHRNIHLPRIKIDHINRLTDSNGIFQFAKLNIADPASGYTIDDNARALVATTRFYRRTKSKTALRLATTYMHFIEVALGKDNVFLNYFDAHMQANGSMESKDDQEDSTTRTLKALMEVSCSEGLPLDLRDRARLLVEKKLSVPTSFVHPRAMAFYSIGLCFLYQKDRSPKVLDEIIVYCDLLASLFYEHSTSDWQWFEKNLTYSNSILSEALALGYLLSGKQEYMDIATKSLRFLLDQTFVRNVYMPIGQNGWYPMSGARAYYDQQPEEVSAMVVTLAVFYSITGEEMYYDFMRKAFYWFLGDNSLGQFVYDSVSGGCYDGIGENNINLNQGAESTISYLIARLTLDSVRDKS